LEGLAIEDADIFYGHLGLFCRHLVYFIDIWSILQTFGILYRHLVYFVVIWYILSRVGKLCQEISGNPCWATRTHSFSGWQNIRRVRGANRRLLRLGLRPGADSINQCRPVVTAKLVKFYCETAGLTFDEVIHSNRMSQMNVFQGLGHPCVPFNYVHTSEYWAARHW
jgi:hypothetical protein